MGTGVELSRVEEPVGLSLGAAIKQEGEEI